MAEKKLSGGLKQPWMVEQTPYNTVEKISLGCNLDGEGESQDSSQLCRNND